jgi:hypothetical protein
LFACLTVAVDIAPSHYIGESLPDDVTNWRGRPGDTKINNRLPSQFERVLGC